MKNILFILSLPLFYSCHKLGDSISTPVVKTYEQAWDSIGLQYEKKYWFQHESLPPDEYDTIIFHSDKSITEIYPAVPPSGASASITYFPTHNDVYYYKDLRTNTEVTCIKFFPMNDTFTGHFPLHDYLSKDTAILIPGNGIVWAFEFPLDRLLLNILAY
jgi:hypothetical protein